MSTLGIHFDDSVLLFAQQQANLLLVYSLWIGVGLLFLLSLILVWTRWGQAKPLSKCIALSVFAHILLGGYAYGTRLIFTYSETANEQPVAFSVVEEWSEPEPLEPNSDQDQPTEEKPWESFADSDSGVPEDLESTKLSSHEAKVPQRKPVETEISHQVHEIETGIAQQLVQKSQPELQQSDDYELEHASDLRDAPSTIVDLPDPEKKETPVASPTRVEPDIEKVPVAELVQQTVPKPESRSTEIDTTAIKDQITKQVEPQPVDYATTSEEPTDANSVVEANPEPVIRNAGFRKNQPSNNPARPKVERRRLADGQAIPELYKNRFLAKGSLLINENGGTKQSQLAVEQALKWLSSEQSEDGRWNPRRFSAGKETNVYGHNRGGAGFNADTGITGLVVLAFLGAGHTHFEGPYQRQVQKGLEFLIRKQNPDGSMYGDAGLFARTYCHGMAMMAISEAYSMTGDHRIKPFIEKAQQYTVKTQNQLTGGWRYRAGDDGDMSQFGWQVMALKSAETAGIAIPAKTRKLMIKFLNTYKKGKHGGVAAYRPAEKPSRTMTAESLFCKRLLAMDVSAAESNEAIRFVLEELPGDSEIDNLYFWYYGTLALHEEKSRFGFHKTNWNRWNQKLQNRLYDLQVGRNELQGSFSNETLWSTYGGKFYSTAMATLCLEVYYRYNTGHKRTDRTARR